MTNSCQQSVHCPPKPAPMSRPWRHFLTVTGHFRTGPPRPIGAKQRSLRTDQSFSSHGKATGAGKSVLLALMALQFRRYCGAQVFAFDFGGSIRAAILAMVGDWHDLGGELTDEAETAVFLQPLARIDDPAERSWAAGWISAILAREGVAITPDVKEHLWTALTSLASAPIGERTITGLAVLLQASDLKQALRPIAWAGRAGGC